MYEASGWTNSQAVKFIWPISNQMSGTAAHCLTCISLCIPPANQTVLPHLCWAQFMSLTRTFHFRARKRWRTFWLLPLAHGASIRFCSE